MPNSMPRILPALLAAVVLALCAAGARAAVPVTFWTTEVSPDRQAVIGYLAQAFMVFNPDVEVRVVGVEENDMARAMAQAQAEGLPPDVVGCASNLVVAFSNQGWMDEAGNARVIDAVGRDRFFAGTLRRVSMSDGKPCGIPFNGWVQGIWYRKDWFEAAGLAPPDTWERILKAAKTLNDPANGRYGILVGTRNDAYAEQVFTHLAKSAGVREVSPEGKVVFDSPAAVRTLKFYAELARYTPPGPQWWRGRDYYLQGRLAMMFYSSFIMDDFVVPSVAADSLTGDNFEDLSGAPFDYELPDRTGMVAILTGTRKAGFGVLHALGLVKTGDAARSEAARRFVRFLFREDAYVTWLHMVPGGMLPVLRDIVAHPTFYCDVQGIFHKYRRERVEAILAGFDSLKSFEFEDGRLIPQAARISAAGVIGRMIVDTLDGRSTPEGAVREAAERMREILEERR
ncbi:carbohydrate ABC transporter substrate-binding protein (CUT1 family) [Pseudodesulfovibrio indicus]|uniref:Carbohydrate ABC transporter substrate-binding protein (CUT1 family) n=2 Tax=Pseudodesulfovibrio indicus TaxID=1716143 RepID=A0AA94TLF9_9BACT|nr:extracellular solute-binding protein [Pseudodesulfovibrio indicus]TDT90889.1 carbohydrate ABC transporter substrate-binding protein (CUT1 family) [Pseudodesulfovibrio indicus]